MSRKPKAIVFDTWAVLAYLQEEPSGKKIAEIIAEAHENHTPMYINPGTPYLFHPAFFLKGKNYVTGYVMYYVV